MATDESKIAVILTSGGLDSTTVLAYARSRNYLCHTLSFDYGQRHKSELYAARRNSALGGAVEHKEIALDLASIGGSALTDSSIQVPEQATAGIPITYVPARNSIFLAIALGWAEVLQADAIFIGVNAVDYSGYPDCRPEFIDAFERLANLATRRGAEGSSIRIETPLMHMSKGEIIRLGISLGVDYRATVSCYQSTDEGLACGLCDACRLRRQGFAEAGIADPTRYQSRG